MAEAVLTRAGEQRVRRGIYVETFIRAPLEEVWTKTQAPEAHQRWDLRFSSIDSLPRADESRPRRFRYATRLGFGARIEGEGETVATREGAAGERTSSLRFGSADAKSLIRDGGGYWRYVPTEDGVRFLTWFDYRTRWGMMGRAADVVFRPLMAWATAWSFDRLRLWIERGIDPALSMERSLAHATARVTLAFVFLWHGIVPKLLVHHPDEIRMLVDGGVPASAIPMLNLVHGTAEVALGLALLVFWHWRGLFPLIIAFCAFALAAVAIASPQFLTAAFTPVTFNACVAALAATGWIASRDLPSARRCVRRRPESAS